MPCALSIARPTTLLVASLPRPARVRRPVREPPPGQESGLDPGRSGSPAAGPSPDGDGPASSLRSAATAVELLAEELVATDSGGMQLPRLAVGGRLGPGHSGQPLAVGAGVLDEAADLVLSPPLA